MQQDNCFIFRHTDEKEQFTEYAAEKLLNIAIFLHEAQNYVYRRKSVEDARRTLRDHIWTYLSRRVGE